MSYLDEFDVCWNGGPLLPDRDSYPDDRWNGVSPFDAPLECERHETKKKRRYLWKKSNHPYFWARRQYLSERLTTTETASGGRFPTVRHRPAHQASGTTAEGDGAGGQCIEPIQTTPTNQADGT